MTTALFLIVIAAALLFRSVGWLAVAGRQVGPGMERKLAWLPAVSSLLAARAGTLSHARNAAAVVASALAGYVGVALVVFVATLTWGLPGNSYYKIGETTPGFAAHGVLEPGDLIIAVDGEPVWSRRGDERGAGSGAGLAEIVDGSDGRPLEVTYERAGARRSATLTPRLDEVSRTHRLGIQLLSEPTLDRPGPAGAAALAASRPARKIGTIARDFLDLMTGEVKETFTGPVGITALVAGAMQETMASFAVYIGASVLIDLFLIDLGVLATLAFLAARARLRRRT
jgi:hypothetical protein